MIKIRKKEFLFKIMIKYLLNVITLITFIKKYNEKAF